MKTQNEIYSYMKRTCCTIICLIALAFNSALSQQPPAPPPGTPDTGDFSKRLQGIIAKASNPSPEPVLTRFDLDFPGGTPKELVAAIEKATGRPLNAIVEDEYSNVQLPELKMTSVTVQELFQALTMVSREYGFDTRGEVSNDSIWSFSSHKAAPPAKV